MNPPVPSWLEKDYFQAISELAKIDLHKIAEATDPETVRAILSVIAISKGIRVAARILHNYSEEELIEMENRYFD